VGVSCSRALSLSLSCSRSLPFSFSLFVSLSFSRSLSRSLSFALSCSCAHSFSLSLSLSIDSPSLPSFLPDFLSLSLPHARACSLSRLSLLLSLGCTHSFSLSSSLPRALWLSLFSVRALMCFRSRAHSLALCLARLCILILLSSVCLPVIAIRIRPL